MSLAPDKLAYSPDDLLTMPDGGNFELVNGQLVEKKMGWEASYVATRLVVLISIYLEKKPLGWANIEGSYLCFAHDPTMVRKPDLSFLSFERLPKTEPPPRGHCRVAPDLAVEVVSPRNTFTEIEEKLQDYLQAGVRLAWVIDPASRTAQVRRPNDANIRLLGENDRLEGEPVLPGFSCRVGDLFLPPA